MQTADHFEPNSALDIRFFNIKHSNDVLVYSSLCKLLSSDVPIWYAQLNKIDEWPKVQYPPALFTG